MTFPIEPGAPAMQALYAILDDGRTYATAWEEDQPGTPSLPGPGRIVTVEEYQAEVDRIRAANEARHEQQRAQEEEGRRTVYEALRALGMPDGPARDLSRYRPPE